MNKKSLNRQCWGIIILIIILILSVVFSFTILEKRVSFYEELYSDESVEDKLIKVDNLTAEEIMRITDEKIQKDIFMADGYAKMNILERKTITEKCLSELVDAGYIVEGSVLFNEKSSSYTFSYACNVIGSIELKNWSDKRNGVNAVNF